MALPASLQPLLQQARSRFEELSARERLLLVGGSLAVVVTLVYLVLVEPLARAHRERTEALASARAIAHQLEAAAASVGSASRSAGTANLGRNMSLLAAVDQSTRTGTLTKAPERLQPEGEREVKVWFSDVSFDSLVAWLAELQTRYGVAVQTVDIEAKPTPGMVDARLSLTRKAP